jgi:hypothetical protein
VETTEKKLFIDEFKSQWKSMWQNLLDDKIRAESISDKDYSLLPVDRGTVIIATRDFRLLDFNELLHDHGLEKGHEVSPPDQSVGGWGKFIRTTLAQSKRTKRGRSAPFRMGKHSGQLKKCGRGWLHFKG